MVVFSPSRPPMRRRFLDDLDQSPIRGIEEPSVLVVLFHPPKLAFPPPQHLREFWHQPQIAFISPTTIAKTCGFY